MKRDGGRLSSRWLLAGVLSFVTACGQGAGFRPWAPSDQESRLGFYTPEDGQKVQLDLDVLRDQGTPAESTGNALMKPGSSGLRLKRGSRLLALVDTACMGRAGQGLAADVAGGRSRELPEQAYAFTLQDDTEVDELVARAESDGCVLKVGNDMTLYAIGQPNDPSFNQQWAMRNVEAAVGYDTFYGAKGINNDVVIAIVDTGVNYNHADLRANMWRGSNGAYGRDFVNNDNDPMDDQGHGTHCAGLAAGVSDNGVGIAGIMGQRSKIMGVKVLGANGSGSTEAIVNGVNWAVQNGAQVVSLSLGMQGSNSVFGTAIQNAVARGVTVLMAAGNDSRQLSSSTWYTPASYGAGVQGAMAIGSITSANQRSSFSNYGPAFVELGSPGSDILSTLVSGGYGNMSGTSMATPIVAGAAGLVIGLLKARGANPTPALVEQLLMEGAVKDSALQSAFRDGNRLNLRALAALINQRYPGDGGNPPPTEPPPTEPPPNPNPPPTTPPPPPVPPPPVPPPPSPECPGMPGPACEMVRAVNAARQQYGMAPLAPHSGCQRVAQAHAEDMARNRFVSHTSPTQGSFPQRARGAGLVGFAAENLASGPGDGAGVVDFWLRGRGNYGRNIMNRSFRSVGAGVSVDAQGRHYYDLCLTVEAPR